MSVKTINSFRFKYITKSSHKFTDFDDPGNSGTVFELKFNSLPESASKVDKYQWYLCLGSKRYDLEFKRIENGIRYFTLRKNSHFIKEIMIDVDKSHMVIVFESTASLHILTKF